MERNRTLTRGRLAYPEMQTRPRIRKRTVRQHGELGLAARSWLRTAFASLLFTLCVTSGMAGPNLLGDLDGNGVVDIRDLVLLINHINGTTPLPAAVVPYADLNQDGVVDQQDVILEASVVLGLGSPAVLPLARVVQTSPANGEGEVSVTRPTLFKLSMPLSATAVVTTNQVYATFGGRHLLSWVEVSADRKTVTLFYQEPVPGSARIRVLFDGTGLTDFLGRPVALAGDGVPGGQVLVDFDTLNNNALGGTIVAGRVFASELATQGTNEVNQPLAGVTVTVDGQEETLRAVSDQFGNFRLDPAPAGPFFVHIDGRTATNALPGGGYPNGPYYPYVGKEWVGSPGVEVNIGNVYLPLIAAGTLQSVSPTQPTSITFPNSVLTTHPELTGVTLNVPPNSLFSDDGTRGGRVGIAPVPPDRLPSALPLGLQFSLVITVQSDGPLNFDQPVPACFPNLPDPTTGQVLPPGAKSALWSFNHRDGRWEIQGSMTVSADGKLLCTDPGVGISFPGWHGFSPNGTARGGGLTAGGGPKGPKEPGPCDPKNATDPVYLYSGEFQESVTDMMIKGRGMDFLWTRKYRSRIGPNTVQGNRWDCIENLFLEQQGTNLVLHDGHSRTDTYTRQADGTYAAPEFFQQLAQNADGSYTMTLADNGKWLFYPIDGSPKSGKRSAIVDRYGNSIQYQYDSQGRLSIITDTLGRNIQIAYNPQGYIASLTDFAGRVVRYSYYDGTTPGGNAGDLKSVTTPAVTGTPNGNDFPNGKTTTYTYSTGFADDRLNHDLLTITDGRRNDTNDTTYGQGPSLVNIYASTTDPSDPSFNHVVRQIWGGNSMDMVYVPILPSNANGNAVVKTIVRDRNGHVKEYFYDDGNRMVRTREFTGLADTTQPTTELSNRPQGKLRPSDPNYFEAIYEWTADSLERQIIHPNGNITQYTYEADLNPNALARTRGNLRQVQYLPGSHLPAGDQSVITESYDYDTSFGNNCCGFNFVTRHVDGRGNATLYSYDAQGNRIQTLFAVPGVVEDWEYNSFGQMTAHILPADAAGNRRRDEQAYYTNGPQNGYMQQQIMDATGLRLTTTFNYDAVGNVTRVIDPRGNDTQRVVNQLDQIVRMLSPEVTTGSGIRYVHDYFYDANNNLTRVDVLNLDENGVAQSPANFTTRYDYEILNYPIRVSQQIDGTRFAIREFAYDGNRNRTLIRQPEAVNGHQPANVVQIQYDERDLPFQVTAAPGDATQSTSETDYDANGNRIRTLDGIEAGAHITSLQYDGYNRLVAMTDPMGNQRLHQLDASGNVVHFWSQGELVDVPGSANNIRLEEATRGYDALNRLVRIDEAHFDPASQQPIGTGTATQQRQFAPNSQLVRVINANGHEVDFGYDTANRMVSLTDARGNSVVRAFDPNGNLLTVTATDKSDLSGPDAAYTTHYDYDNLNRLIRVTDNGGDINEFGYDSRNNRVLMLDAARASATAAGNRTHVTFDGLSRWVQVSRNLTSDGTGAGSVTGQIIVQRQWDDDTRPISVSDGNGNVTQYSYDPLDRLTRTVLASGTVRSMQYDAHSDAVSITDANGTVIQQKFDALDRVTRKDITPSAGVAADTTFEQWSYDGLSRPVNAVNNGIAVAESYDSLDNLTRDTIGNRTVQRAYDDLGNPVATTYPGGRKTAATYDVLDRLASLADVSTPTPSPIANYKYVGSLRMAAQLNGNNTRLDLTYDAIGRLVRSTHSVAGGAAFEDHDYAWDANSNRTLDRDRLPGGFSQTYAYDSVYRLVSATFTGSISQQHTYQFDTAGNRQMVTGGNGAGTYSFSGPSMQNAVLNQYSATPFDQRAYDLNGNLIQITGTGQPSSLGFDYLNRLVRFASGGVTNRYVYDAMGRRVARSTGSGTILYSYLGTQVVEEEDGTGAVQATYVCGLAANDVVSMRRNGKDYWLHSDDRLTVRRLTDASGNVVESYTYDEYGNPSVFDSSGHSLSSSAVGNPYLFTGYRYDPETGLYYAQHRYYDARTGRFISRDPSGAWGDPRGLGNAFTYAGNNPGTYVDPMGLKGRLPTPGQVAGPATTTAANVLLNQGGKALAQGAQATAEAERISASVGNELLNWTEGYLNGSVHGEPAFGEGEDLIQRVATSEEEAARMVNFQFAGGVPKAGFDAESEFMTEAGSMYRQRSWYQQSVQEVEALEEKGAQLASKGSKLKVAGKVLGVIGVAVQTGVAIHEDIKNCAGVGHTINDAVATAGANAIVVFVLPPPLAVADLATGGSLSGGLHNAAMLPTVVADLKGRMSNRDMDNIKSSFTRTWATQTAWDAGEYWSNNSYVQGFADWLVGN